MDKQKRKILITGATGLVGARLLPRLISAGWECNALVRGHNKIATGAIPVNGNLFEAKSLKDAVKDVSAIIHLAAVFRTQDTDLIWKSNMEGTRNLIEAAIEYAPNTRFILASTAHVYNVNNPHPGREDDTVEPEHAYPASKIAAENLLRESGLNWSVLRFPFVYGDNDKHLEMLPKQVAVMKWHPAMKISTIHHRDIAAAVEMALAGTFDSRIVNIADESTLSLYEMARIIGETIPSSAEALQNPWYLHVDASLARSLGFRADIRTAYQAAQQNIL